MAETVFRWTQRNYFLRLADTDKVIRNVFDDQIRFLLDSVGDGIIQLGHIKKDKIFIVDLEMFSSVARFKIVYYDRRGHIKDTYAELDIDKCSPIFLFIIQSLFDEQQR